MDYLEQRRKLRQMVQERLVYRDCLRYCRYVPEYLR